MIQVDGEPAIKTLSEAVITSLNGEFGIPISEITTDHPIFLWMVKHAEFTHNRFHLDQDGQTPHSRTWGQKYKSAIIAFGET
eukprot:5410066-Amphidinium_carterae.1